MAAIDQIPLGDRKRFGTAFLFMQDQQAVDWKAAAAAYDPKVKPESFATVTKRAMKKGNKSVEGHTEADLGRFAICFIFVIDNTNVDWKGAAAAFDAKVKPESFSTVTKRALKKVSFAPERKNGVIVAGKKDSAQDGDEPLDGPADTEAGAGSVDDATDGAEAKTNVKKGRKRKTDGASSARGGKKVKAEATADAGDDANGDVEEGAEDLPSQIEDGPAKHESDGYEADPLLSEEARMIDQQINGEI